MAADKWNEMTKWQAFWFGFAQGAETILLPFIVVYERLTGRWLGRLNEDDTSKPNG